jgi:hypothetical protein
MDDVLARIWQGLADRVTGPMAFRLALQPLMAVIMATRSGLRDAKEGRPAFLWCLFTADTVTRHQMLQGGWRSIWRVFVVAIVLDVVYQLIVGGVVDVDEALLVAFLLSIVPYSLLRGPVNRVARAFARPR